MAFTHGLSGYFYKCRCIICVEARRLYSSEYCKSTRGKKAHKRYETSLKGIDTRKIRGIKKFSIPEQKIKNKARRIVFYAIKTSKIIKSPCLVCGDVKSQGHHEDYNKPLDVVWLCQIHHAKWHRDNIKASDWDKIKGGK